MIQKKIAPADIENHELRNLYQTAFPEEEQIPWTDLMRLIEQMPLDFTAYYEGEEFVGINSTYATDSGTPTFTGHSMITPLLL